MTIHLTSRSVSDLWATLFGVLRSLWRICHGFCLVSVPFHSSLTLFSVFPPLSLTLSLSLSSCHALAVCHSVHRGSSCRWIGCFTPAPVFIPSLHLFLSTLLYLASIKHTVPNPYRWVIFPETQVQSHQRGAGPRSQRHDFNVIHLRSLPVHVPLPHYP